MIRNSWREIRVKRKCFFRCEGSFVRWYWLAIIVRGNNHIVRIRRGDDKGSEKKVDEKLLLLPSV